MRDAMRCITISDIDEMKRIRAHRFFCRLTFQAP